MRDFFLLHCLQHTLVVKRSFFSNKKIRFRSLWLVYNLCTLGCLSAILGLKIISIWSDMAIIVFLPVECLTITCMNLFFL